jgi:branched-chain amino acid transport system ATP-binding protein
MFEIRNLNVFHGLIHVLYDVSMEVKEGEMVALLGSNGAGKTTLVNTVSGIYKASSGSIIFQGEHIENKPPHEIVKRGIIQVPEGRRILPYLTVEENLYLGAYTNEAWRKRRQSIERVYALFPVLKERRKVLAGSLSGGEQQMLVIGRGLMAMPKFMMFDEPSLGLAPKLLSEVYRTLAKLRDEKITILLSEQNVRQALAITHRGYVLENGRIILSGDSKELLNNEMVKKAYLGV